MTVNVRIFQPTGYSFGIATLSRTNDVLAIDLDTSRNFAIHLKDGSFRSEVSLVDSPSASEWIRIQLVQGGSQGYSFNLSDKFNFGIAKWIRFILLDTNQRLHEPNPEKPPTIQWRSIKNTSIVTSDTTLEVRDSAPRSLTLSANSSVEYSLEAVVSTQWFNADRLTRYSVESSDSTIVSTSLLTRYRLPRDQQERIPDKIRISAKNFSGRSATVSISAVDAAGNTATLEIEVNVTP